MLFGVLTGSINYIAGSVTSKGMKYVMLMLGFTEHKETADSAYTKTVVSITDGRLVDLLEEEYIKTASTATAFKYLLKLAEKWPYFFWLIRTCQTLAPYLFLLTVDGAVISAYFLLLFYFFV